eukprot:11514-Amphidinium_carterae.1
MAVEGQKCGGRARKIEQLFCSHEQGPWRGKVLMLDDLVGVQVFPAPQASCAMRPVCVPLHCIRNALNPCRELDGWSQGGVCAKECP